MQERGKTFLPVMCFFRINRSEHLFCFDFVCCLKPACLVRYHVHPLYILSQGFQMFHHACRCLRTDSLVHWTYLRLRRVKILWDSFFRDLENWICNTYSSEFLCYNYSKIDYSDGVFTTWNYPALVVNIFLWAVLKRHFLHIYGNVPDLSAHNCLAKLPRYSE